MSLIRVSSDPHSFGSDMTSPSAKDACRRSLLCRSFRSAAESDIVPDKFLPPETRTIRSQSGESGLLAARSKELYLALCNQRLLIDDGKLSFSLDRWSGKKCYMISARELGIVWSDKPCYWKWNSHPESRCQEVAELLKVCWLEINGKLETRLLSSSTLYKVCLVYKFTRRAYGFEDLAAEVTVGLEGGEHTTQTVTLRSEGEMNYLEEEPDFSEEEPDFSEEEPDFSKGESDVAEGETHDPEVPEVVINDDRYRRESPGWLKIEMGKFFCEEGEDGLLKMRCLALGNLNWKSGLIVEGIEVRPSEGEGERERGVGTITCGTVMGLLRLPDYLIAKVISLTSPSPKDACRLSLLCWSFRSAAESDIVWDKFLPPESDIIWDKLLPPETHTIVSQSGESGLLAARSKTEFYLALYDKPILIHDGKLSFSLDRWSGKKCYMISAKELGIFCSDDPRHWKWKSHPESRFQEVAELLDVCWLEIHGKLQTCLLSPSTLYKVYLVFKFTRRAYGFKHLPLEVTIGLEGGERTSKTLFLHYKGEMNYSEEEPDFSKGESDVAKGETSDPEVPEVVINDDRYQRESPGWLKIEMGEFFCEGREDGLLKMHCLAVGSLNRKSGLIVEGIEIRVSSDLHSSVSDMTSPSPKDACQRSLLCWSFRSAAESDIVWDKFLPPESDIVWDKFLPPESDIVWDNKKELCLALCNKPLLIQDGKLSFSLDKWSGKKCYMISARELGIVWSDDPRYWKWNSHPESRFQEVAELLDAGSLEIHGKLETRLLSPSTLYKVYLVYKFTRRAYGFQYFPVEVTVGLEGGEHTTQTVPLPYYGEMLDFEWETRAAEVSEVVINDDRYQRERPGWLKIEMGEFFCGRRENGLLKMRYLVKESRYRKSGLIVEGIKVRPKRKY